MTYHKLPFPKVICQTTTFKWAKKGKKHAKKQRLMTYFQLSIYLLTLD